MLCSCAKHLVENYLVTVSGFARERVFSTTFDTKPNVQIYEKVSYEALNPLSCKTLVKGSFYSSSLFSFSLSMFSFIVHDTTKLIKICFVIFLRLIIIRLTDLIP